MQHRTAHDSAVEQDIYRFRTDQFDCNAPYRQEATRVTRAEVRVGLWACMTREDWWFVDVVTFSNEFLVRLLLDICTHFVIARLNPGLFKI